MEERAETEAMRAFSEAMVNGVHVMDLPDAPQKKQDEMSDEMATMMYSEQVNDKTLEEEKVNTRV